MDPKTKKYRVEGISTKSKGGTRYFNKDNIAKEFKISENDNGSTPVQIALISSRIDKLTEHSKIHKHDYSSKKGLVMLVDKRRKLLSYLRKNIAVVLQDIFLFSDTIHNNITLGDEQITRSRVIEASKAVGAHDFISQLPGNYDYSIGERGTVLSVGQRQLLSFIRAFVYNPQVLNLDEATSSVDNESEVLIQRATEQITKGRTSIVIAHRMSTIQNADLIVVMEKGEVIESGTHQQLIKQDGKYNTLYEKQIFQPNG